MSILIIAEHDNEQLKSETLKLVNAAASIGQKISVLVIGSGCGSVAEQATKIQGISRVLLAANENYEHQLSENVSELVVELAAQYTHIFASASSNGKSFMPRVAALLDVAQISDIIRVESSDTFVRPIYAGNAIATVQSSDKIKVITVRTSAFALAELGNSVEIEMVESVKRNNLTRFISEELTVSERPELGAAQVIISGGRGMQNGDNFKLLDGVADKLGAAIGASRAAVDAGFVPNDMQIGQTGKIVAPDLYIAVGISGAIQHLAGMKDSKVIVAINKDEEAPIFQVADYGIVGDLFDIVPELESAL